MCIIIDANKCNELANPNAEGYAELQPVKKWMKRGGIIVFAPEHPEFRKELMKCSNKFKRLWEEHLRRGLVTNIDADKVEGKRKTLQDLQSNDDHIIALALVSGTKVLVSGDIKLHKDFTNKKNGAGGRVYQYKKQARSMLTQNTCP